MFDYSRASLELLYNVSRELTADLDLRTVLERVISLSSKYVGAERASIIVVDELQQPVDAAIIVDDRLMPHTVDQLRSTMEQGLAGWVFRNRQSVLVANTSRDERWLRRPDDSASQSGEKSAICVPIIARERVVGILTIVHPTPDFFEVEHLSLIQAIADQAGVTVENARLYQSLNNAMRRYHELFDDSIDPIWITDWSGNLVEANRQAAHLSGIAPSDLSGRKIGDLLHLADDWFVSQIPNLRSGQTEQFEALLSSGNGSTTPVEVNVRRVNMGSGELLQWILNDITERKELDALRDELMAMVYHDLRSPLSNIISSIDMLKIFLPADDENLQTILTIAQRSSDRMQRLINTLLDIYRLEAGQPITNRKKTELAVLVNDAVEALQPVTENKEQNLQLEIDPDLPSLMIDTDMIRRVIINLLDNATKYTPQKGAMMVKIQRVGREIQCTIVDNGPGIPQEALDLIFDKFSRLQADRFPKGFGLGLAFCRLAVRAHGGRIWVESQLHHGSRFIFTLPVDQEAVESIQS